MEGHSTLIKTGKHLMFLIRQAREWMFGEMGRCMRFLMPNKRNFGSFVWTMVRRKQLPNFPGHQINMFTAFGHKPLEDSL